MALVMRSDILSYAINKHKTEYLNRKLNSILYMIRTNNALSTAFRFHTGGNKLKSILFTLLLFISQQGFSQTLSQQNFTGIIVPQYMAATGTNTRLPIIFRAKISGLSANSSYRYYVQGTTSADFGTSNSGSGMSVLINAAAGSYMITSSPGLSTSGAYETFTTDASGTYTGWFGMVNTTGTRFTAGNELYPTLTLNNGNGGTTPAYRFALDQSVKVITIGTTAGANFGTGIWSSSSASAKNIVALYDNTTGSGRPLAVTYVEDESVAVTSTPAFYTNNVNAKAGNWGALVPNINTNGVRKIEQFSLSTGSSIACATDADGVWPTGNINTVNPTGGTTALQISGMDAPLNTLCGNSVSNLSDISASNTFTYPQNINYIQYQEANDITLANTSLEVASFDLRDGGGTTDADNLPTTLTALSFNVSNAGFIRRAALYHGNTELAETSVTGSTISFSGFSVAATDNGAVTLILRVSYTQQVTDNAQNIFTVSSAAADNAGSGFISTNAGASSSSTFADNNRIEVVASKLNFTTEPANNATIYKLLSTIPVVSAQDIYNNTDADFTGAITLGNSSGLGMENTTSNMQSGAANFPLLYFTTAGNTKLTATADGINQGTSQTSITIADAKKWDGEAGTNLWSDAANWSGNTIPDAEDVVILDNTFTDASYNVVLPNTSVTVKYLKISAAAGKNITLTLPVTNVACPGFTVGDNTAGTEDLVIENGGIFINANGCSLGQGFVINAQGSNKAIAINDGGKYIHRNAKSHTEFLDAAILHENSEVVFDVNAGTSYVISLSNRTFGNLTLSAASKGATQAYSSNYAGVATVKGNLTTETKATLSLSGNGNLQIGGNILNNGTFSTGNTSRKLVMNGTKAQAFSGTGTYTIKALEINNAAGVSLNVPITLSNTIGSGLTLTSGNLYTSSLNTLTLSEYATVTGGSKNSFVSGPITKIFSTNSQANIVLPLGKDTLYRPVTLTPESVATSSTFKAEYFNATAPYDLTKFDNTLESISIKEYWNVQRTSGSTNAIVGFIYGESSGVNNVEDLKIAQWNGTEWTSIDQQTAIGTTTYGSVSTNNISQFGTFTFGSKKTVPLPVSWLYFTVKATRENAVLNWATASEINNSGFEIQRSLDGENFEVIGWVNGNGTSNQKHFYSYTDMEFAGLNTSTVYYRLKQIDFNGAFDYSTLQVLRKDNNAFTSVSIYADAQKYLHVNVKSEINAPLQVEILNMNGQVLKSVSTYVSAGNNQIKLPAQELKAGLYVVKFILGGTIYTEKIVL